MKCPQCGATVTNEFAFCITCGTDMSEPQAPGDGEIRKSRERDTHIKILTVLIIGLIVFAMLFGFFLPRIMSPKFREYPAESEFSVDRVIAFQAGNQKKYSIDMTKARDLYIGGRKVQSIEGVSLSPQGYVTVPDRYSWDWLYWNGTLGAGKKITVIASYTVKNTLWQWNPDIASLGTAGNVDSSMKGSRLTDEWQLSDDSGAPADRDTDGRPDVMIEPSSPVIRNLSESITKNATSANGYDVVKSIYSYIVRNIKYKDSSGEPKHALWTLRTLSGDCDEQTALFLSLVRAAGFPCWFSFGALYDPSQNVWGGHAWAVVYVPYIDGTGVNVTVDTTNREFAARDTFHLTSWEDASANATALTDYYTYLTYEPSDEPGQSESKPSEGYTSVSFVSSDKTVRIYDEDAPKAQIPGFELIAVVAGVAVAFIVVNRLRKRPGG